MRIPMRRLLILAGLLGSLNDLGAARQRTITDRGVLVPEVADGNVTLDISNQDRTVDPLDVRVFLDGTSIIRAKIAIGQIHPSYERYHLNWTPGNHEVKVESARVPAKLVSTVKITGKRFLVVLYGYPPHAT